MDIHVWLTELNPPPINTILEHHLRASQIQVRKAPGGKPYLHGRHEAISISHCLPYTALAIADTTQIGIDLERCHNLTPEDILLAASFYTDDEATATNQDPSGWHFYKLWTAKEAHLKATGQGITNGLSMSRFYERATDWITTDLSWKITHLQPLLTHILAVAYPSNLQPTILLYKESI